MGMQWTRIPSCFFVFVPNLLAHAPADHARPDVELFCRADRLAVVDPGEESRRPAICCTPAWPWG